LTKLNPLTDGREVPLEVIATTSQRNTSPEFENVMKAWLISTFLESHSP